MKKHTPRHILFVFLDGVGIGPSDPAINPFFATPMHSLRKMFSGWFPSSRSRRHVGKHAACVPLTVTMGVPGLPQSGTGQSALYSGLNTAKIIGKHFGPYLYSSLKPLLARQNIFRRILNIEPGSSLALANAFPHHFFTYLEKHRGRYVAGVFSALQSDLPLRTLHHLRKQTAVSTDLTGKGWHRLGITNAPVISPYEAGKRLAKIATLNRFTLFEYFLTDKAGHQRDRYAAAHYIEELDACFQGILDSMNPRTLLCITSDHGNLEDLRIKTHTRNPVPLFLVGPGAQRIAGKVHTITDITPAIVELSTEAD